MSEGGSESSSKTTTDLVTIRSRPNKEMASLLWLNSTADKKGGGVLRINFPGYSGEDTWGRNLIGGMY